MANRSAGLGDGGLVSVPLLLLAASAAGAGGFATYKFTEEDEEKLRDTWTERSVWNSMTAGINRIIEDLDKNMSLCAGAYNELDPGYKAFWLQWSEFYDDSGDLWPGFSPSAQDINQARHVAEQLEDWRQRINAAVELNCPDKVSQLRYRNVSKTGVFDTRQGTVQQQAEVQQEKQAAREAAAENERRIDAARQGLDPDAPIVPPPPPTDWNKIAKYAAWGVGGIAGLWGVSLGYRIFKDSR